MDPFFEPRGVAVIGASSKPGKIGHEVLRSIIGSPYSGSIYPINPGVDEILGLRSHPDLDGLEDVDLAVVVLPAGMTPDAVRMACSAGVKAMVIVSGGFAELGSEGKALQTDVVDTARECGMRIIGPNCIGIYNPHSGLDTFFQPRDVMLRPGPGPVAFMTQSGTYGCSILESLEEEGVGVSKFVSYGNKSDVDEIDLLEYLEHDDETTAIGAYIEGIQRGQGFYEAMRRITPRKPIVLVKAGQTEAGAETAKSHTGAMAGDHEVFNGVARQGGAIMADDVEDLIDTLKVLSMQDLPAGGRVAMVTNGVGPCVIAADHIHTSRELDMASLSETTLSELEDELEDYMVVANPVDLTGSATGPDFVQTLVHLYSDDSIDIVMPFLVIQDAPLHSTIDDLISFQSASRSKTTVAVASGGPATRLAIDRIQDAGVPVIPTATRAVKALERIAWYSRWRSARQ